MATAGITTDEAKLYDRQIRLWGVEAQHRMRKSSILIVGMRGLSNEVCKNLVLAGVGAVTLLDHKIVREEDLGAQFFVNKDDIGKNRAVASVDKMRQLNPRVSIEADTDNVKDKPEEYFEKFDLVCLTDCDLETMIRVNKICHSYKKKFYSAAVYGFYGYIFTDLSKHNFTVKGQEKEEEFVDMETALKKSDWSSLSIKKLKRISPLLWALQVLWKFEQEENRLPNKSESDFAKLKVIRDSVSVLIKLQPSMIPNEILNSLALAETELSPVCAIMGGILAQDILYAISHQGMPINNFFVFNAHENSGLIYKVMTGKPPY